MIVLGIETSSRVCSIGLAKNDLLVAEYRLNIRNAHASVLAPSLNKLLRDAGLAIADLDGCAISNGPGSFTGLRIGLSFAKGLAFGNHMACVAVSSLQVLACQAPVRSGIIMPLIKSRANEYMAALYKRSDFVDELLTDVSLLKSGELHAFTPPDAIVIGNYCDSRELAMDAVVAPVHFAWPSGYIVAKLGGQKIRSGHLLKIDNAEPDYYHDFVAGKPKKMIKAR